MNRKKLVWATLCLSALMAVTLWIGLSQHPSSFDDAYITYRYARNIARGRGFVYNAGQPVLGTTTPLYALLLAGLSLIWPNIPTISHVVGTVAWMLCIPVIYGIALVEDRDLVGAVGASLLAVNALFLRVLGMETALYVLVTLLAFYFYLDERPIWAGVCAGLAFLTRWDGVLVTATLGLAGLVDRRRGFIKPLFVSACLIIPWLGYSQITFGSIFPNTLFAKAGQGWNQGLGGAEIGPFTRGLVLIARSAYEENRLILLPLGLSLVGALSALRQRVRWWPLLFWTVAYFGGYAVLGVLRFPWYYPPLVPAFLLLIGQGVAEFTDDLPDHPRWLELGLSLLLVALCLIPSVDWLLAHRRSRMNRHLANYVEVGNWLHDHTPADSSVATIEIGVIGFYSDRTIVDTMGLVSPEMVGHLDTWLQTLQFALNHYWPDYAVVLEDTAWDGVIHRPWFREAYALEKEVENRAKPAAPVRIYRRRPQFPIDEFAMTSAEEVRVDERLALRRFQVAETQVDSGDDLHVQLTWEALDDVAATYLLRFDLLSASDGGRETLREDAHPMRGGNPTRLWAAGDWIVDAHTLRLPDGLSAGPYVLQLLVSREGTAPSLTDSTGSAVDYIAAGPIQIGDDGVDRGSPDVIVEADFADQVSLMGYDLGESGGKSLEVTLYWQAAAHVSRDYTVFVHLISPTGELVAQHDSPPALPTQLWVPGTPVVDLHTLPLPQGLSPGLYEIRTGMYRWPDLERLSIVGSNGFDAISDALLLTDVRIEYSSQEWEMRVDKNDAVRPCHAAAEGDYR